MELVLSGLWSDLVQLLAHHTSSLLKITHVYDKTVYGPIKKFVLTLDLCSTMKFGSISPPWLFGSFHKVLSRLGNVIGVPVNWSRIHPSRLLLCNYSIWCQFEPSSLIRTRPLRAQIQTSLGILGRTNHRFSNRSCFVPISSHER